MPAPKHFADGSAAWQDEIQNIHDRRFHGCVTLCASAMTELPDGNEAYGEYT